MSNSAGPKITKDGLVLDFDAANTKSYNFYADPYASNVSLHLKMDGANGSTTFTDSSPNALAVTAVGNAQISTTQSKYNGSAGYFDGTGDYLSIPDSSAPVLGSSDWTIEAWIYISVAKSFNCIYAKRQPGGYGFGLQIDGANTLSISASTNGSSWALPGSSLGSGYVAGAWTHVAVVRSGNTITGYKNGVSTGTQTLSGTIWPSTGYVAAVASGLAGDTSQNVGTLTNGVDYNFSNGGSLVFDGVNDYINIPASTNLTFGTGDFTMEVWCKTRAKTMLYPALLSVNLAWASNVWVLIDRHNVTAPTKFTFHVYNIASPTLTSVTAPSNGVWYNVVITRIGTLFSMYINGVLESTATSSASIDGGVSNSINLGREFTSDSTYYDGNIPRARIYKGKGLTSGEVYNNFVANRGRFGV